ncbi:TniB family NTP-binding protein [Paraburkholderia sp. BR10936]|uniref:ATP-binding protein n=1 Tax=Paraburkholderia sp. BR10936 TaxID=3236993 RepID=UPI0034D36ADF
MITREQAIAGSPRDRKIYQLNLTIPHRNLDRVLDDVQPLMEEDSGLTIVVIVGPTGVGKSSLGRKLLRKTLEKYSYLIQEDPAIIPAVMVEVDSPDKKQEIDFGLFFARICSALLSPSVLDGFATPKSLSDTVDYTEKSRIMLEKAIVGRDLRHLILDEVIHFLASSTPPEHYGNLLKSLSNRSNFDLLLLGAYGSEEIIHASGQLARRIIILHYQRYTDSTEDYKEYATFMKSVALQMPYRFEIDLEHSVHYLFDGNLGIPGSSVEVLQKAAARCSREKHPKWSDDFLVKYMPSIKAQKEIAMETLRGEEQIQPYLQNQQRVKYATETEIRALLGAEKAERNRLNRNRAR